jgi:hypothetical protein
MKKNISDLSFSEEIEDIIEESNLKGILMGLLICKKMWGDGQISHESIYQNEVYYKEELQKLRQSIKFKKDLDNNLCLELKEFAATIGLYQLRLDDKSQSGGWYRLVEMIKNGELPHEHNLSNFHQNIRPILIENWHKIIELSKINL